MTKIFSVLRMSTGWALFCVLCGATLALGANRPISWTLMSLLILLIFLGTLSLDVFQRRPNALDKAAAPMLLYLIALFWGGIQLLPDILPEGWAHPFWSLVPEAASYGSANPSQGQHILMRLIAYGLIFWIAVRTAQAPQSAHNFLRAFAIFSMALAGYGIYAVNSGSNIFLGELASPNLSASFVNRNSYATFAGFGLVVCLSLLLRNSGSWEKRRRKSLLGLLEGIFAGGWVWVMGILLCGGALMMTQSRAGAVAGIIGVVCLLATIRMRSGKAAVGPLLIFGAIVLVVLFSASGRTIDRLADTASGEEARFLIYPEVWNLIMERPFAGHGLGAFEDVFRVAVPPEAATGAWDKAHNSYLENALELGLPAAAALYLALALIGVQLLRGLLTRRRDRASVAAAFACLMMAGFHASFDFSLQMPALAGFFAWLIGIGYVQSFSSSQLAEDAT